MIHMNSTKKDNDSKKDNTGKDTEVDRVQVKMHFGQVKETIRRDTDIRS